MHQVPTLLRYRPHPNRQPGPQILSSFNVQMYFLLLKRAINSQ